jgi:peptide subunit release factor 1 (eRF1)
MISREDLERVTSHRVGAHPILSLFLDLSVDATDKRTYPIFLNQKRAEFRELRSDRPEHHREPVGAVLERVETWLDQGFARENRGAAIYAEIGGNWFEALQFPVPIGNRLIIADRPVIAPLAQVLRSYHHHGVILIDREHARILSVYLGTLLDQLEVRAEPYPKSHHVQGGGYAEQRYQRRKLEETRHSMHEFARQSEQFVDAHAPDDLVILGTDENVARLRSALSERLSKMVVHSGPAQLEQGPAQVIADLEPFLRRIRQEEERQIAERLRERVRQDYLATAGLQSTLAAMQAGRIETLVVSGDGGATGSRCPRCGFIFGPGVAVCAYDGSPTEGGIPLVEELVRMAETSGVDVHFIEPPALDELRGIGALLRF